MIASKNTLQATSMHVECGVIFHQKKKKNPQSFETLYCHSIIVAVYIPEAISKSTQSTPKDLPERLKRAAN